MSEPQPALFIEEVAEHLHAEWNLNPQADDAAVVAALGQARRAATSLGGPNVVWGFGPNLWRRLSGGRIPSSVRDFAGVGPNNSAGVPVTQSDVWLWCMGNNYPAIWAAASAAASALAPVADLARHQRAYKAADSRDPTGFIDGTENPKLDEALEIALFGDDLPGAQGSAVFVQRWVHNLKAFNRLPVRAQEDVFGRTKSDSTQLPPDQMPATSHVSRNTLTDADGEELHIYRRNTPFGGIDAAGTVYIAATNDPFRVEEMLRRMFDQVGDGLHDELTRFSTPTSGSWYFVPAMSDLTDVFGGLDADDAGDDDAGDADEGSPVGSSSSQVGTGHGTLGIGSLR
ncbi:MAG: Dyp-type peroxidase [Actinobacteria bacterium]|nr:Dyp-type peroxidase [Actinomycetota bacterium]MCB9413061.1 Dyp-type peroxidase [Actinomycetota bacterium]